MTSPDAYASIVAAQRRAYEAWQAAPAGRAHEALAVYFSACDALDRAQGIIPPADYACSNAIAWGATAPNRSARRANKA